MLLTNTIAVYLFKIQQKISKGEYVKALMKCPECGVQAVEFTNDEDDKHIVIRQKIGDKRLYYVAIGCQGYLTVDPQSLGMPRRNWQPVWEILKQNLGYYIKEPKTYAPVPFEEVTEDNKAEIAKVINRDGRLNPGEKADLLKQLDN
jgi:hypothetical protein